jgi:hypothetical protein
MSCNKILCQAGGWHHDTYEKIQKVFDNDSLLHGQVFQWHKDFING